MIKEIQTQEQIQALTVQAMWIIQAVIGLAVAGGVMLFLPKIVGVVKEKKEK